jgi:hypothetical protein
VENFVMPRQSEQYKKMGREAKWKKYLQDEEGCGPSLLACILKKNTMWNNGDDVANRLSNIYKLTSDRFHVTAHEIDSGKDDIVVGLSMQSGMQIVNAMECIGEVLEFDISIHDARPK